MARVNLVMSAFFALTLVASKADHSELLLEKQKILDEKIDNQIKVIDGQIKHLDWYFSVGYTHQGKQCGDGYGIL